MLDMMTDTPFHGREPLFFAPFVSSVMTVRPEWIDYNGHLNMAWYNTLFDRAVDEAFALCGMGPDYAASRGCSFFLVESRNRFRRELSLGDRVRATLRLIAVDDKRMHYCMEIREAAEGWLAATSEHLALHVDMRTRRAASFPADVAAGLDAMLKAHAALAPPDWIGQSVGMPQKPVRH
jgi:acyl-CoA thioester hydrolase